MSYDIIKNIKLDDKNKKVFITCKASNLVPGQFQTGECKTLSAMWEEKGKAEVEKAILYEFFSGNFQKGQSLFNKAVKYALSLKTDILNWSYVSKHDIARNEFNMEYRDLPVNIQQEVLENIRIREEQIKNFLLNCYKDYDSKTKYIIAINNLTSGMKRYVEKSKGTRFILTTSPATAKKFNLASATEAMSRINASENPEIIKVN